MTTSYRAFALLLIFTVTLSARPDVRQTIGKWKQGQRLEAVLITKERVMGKLGAVDGDGFVLVLEDERHTPRTLQFNEVKQVSSKFTNGDRMIVFGLVFGLLTLLGSRV